MIILFIDSKCCFSFWNGGGIGIVKKKIGLKVLSMLVILAVLFFAMILMNISAIKVIGGYNQTVLNGYLGLEEASGKLNDSFTQIQLYANLLYMRSGTDEADSLKEKLLIAVEDAQTYRSKVEEYINYIDFAQLTEAYAGVSAAIDPFMEHIDKIVAAADAKDTDTLSSLVNSIIEYKTPVVEADAAFEDVLAGSVEYVGNRSTIKIEGTRVFDWIMVGVLIVCLAIIYMIVRKTIARPAKKSGEALQNIIDKIASGEGDLTERVPVTTVDEVGQMSAGVNNFIEQLQSLMAKLKSQAQFMMESAETVFSQVSDSNESTQSVSATMEQMSASMEEMSATITQIAEKSERMLGEIQDMDNRMKDGVSLVNTIKSHAGEMNTKTIQSKDETGKIISSIREELQAALEQSRSVEKINELTSEILSISSQTNLLSLNASIEAARAGEAGRGFAVVADEIRGLADNSAATAGNIQNISNTVIGAVEQLAKNASRVLEFIDEKVMKDYDGFIDVMKQYAADADTVNEIFNAFAQSTNEIHENVDGMNQGIHDISIAVEESAKGVTDVAVEAVNLVDAMKQIREETLTNQEISQALTEEVNRFKKV